MIPERRMSRNDGADDQGEKANCRVKIIRTTNMRLLFSGFISKGVPFSSTIYGVLDDYYLSRQTKPPSNRKASKREALESTIICERIQLIRYSTPTNTHDLTTIFSYSH